MASVLSLWPCARDMAGWGGEHPNYSDEAAFSEFYVEVWPRLLKRLRFHYQVEPSQLEDVAQQAFLLLWKQRDKIVYPDIEVFYRYFWRIVQWLVWDERRRHQVQSLQALAEAVDGDEQADTAFLLTSSVNVEQQVITHMQVESTAQALKQCSKKLQRSLLLQVAGYSLEEISQRMGVTPVAVTQHLRRARQQLRQEVLKKRTKRQAHWSAQHAACVACGTTERPHEGRGMCGLCWKRDLYRRQLVTPRKQWSTIAPACVDCGTTERPHDCKGRCQMCYKRYKKAQGLHIVQKVMYE